MPTLPSIRLSWAKTSASTSGHMMSLEQKPQAIKTGLMPQTVRSQRGSH